MPISTTVCKEEDKIFISSNNILWLLLVRICSATADCSGWKRQLCVFSYFCDHAILCCFNINLPTGVRNPIHSIWSYGGLLYLWPSSNTVIYSLLARNVLTWCLKSKQLILSVTPLACSWKALCLLDINSYQYPLWCSLSPLERKAVSKCFNSSWRNCCSHKAQSVRVFMFCPKQWLDSLSRKQSICVALLKTFCPSPKTFLHDQHI